MAEETDTILLPKMRKIQLLAKIMLDPADFNKGLPKQKLPEINQQGLILSLESRKVGTAKLNGEGSMKLNVWYDAQVLTLIGRYIQVKVIDDYDSQWVGELFGITVKGSGGEGSVRGCRVLRFQKNCLIVEGLKEGGYQGWEKLLKKIQRILQLSI